MEVHANKSGAIECLPTFDTSDRHNEYPISVCCRERNDIAECFKRLWHSIEVLVMQAHFVFPVPLASLVHSFPCKLVLLSSFFDLLRSLHTHHTIVLRL